MSRSLARIDDYELKQTPSGQRRFYLSGKAIARKNVPEEIVDELMSAHEPAKSFQGSKGKSSESSQARQEQFDEPELRGKLNQKDILYTSPVYQGYEFEYHRNARRQFYRRGRKISSRKVPERVLQVLNRVDAELDFFDLIHERTGKRRKGVLEYEIEKRESGYLFFYLYKGWEIPADRVPRRWLARAELLESPDSDSYFQEQREAQKRREHEILVYREETYQKQKEETDAARRADKVEEEEGSETLDESAPRADSTETRLLNDRGIYSHSDWNDWYERNKDTISAREEVELTMAAYSVYPPE